MSDAPDEFIKDFHWLMDVLQTIDVGIVVLDLDMNVKLWNSFMQNHSGIVPTQALEHNLFDLFTELPEAWLRRKLESVTILNTASFTTWEERPYLFKFKNHRPVTGTAEFMYQNSTILPIRNARGEVTQISLILYDVTEIAVNRLQLVEANKKLHYISQKDGLTGLYNRKTWESLLQQEFSRYQRFSNPCSLIMFDIDHFKKVNDNYGHPMGDEVIRQTANLLQKCVRTIDLAGRYGGEEYVVILVETDASGAQVVAERIRKTIEQTVIEYDGRSLNHQPTGLNKRTKAFIWPKTKAATARSLTEKLPIKYHSLSTIE